MTKVISIFFLMFCLIYPSINSYGQSIESEIVELLIKPSLTDNRIKQTDVDHLVLFKAKQGASKLFLFLPGTNGIPIKGPRKLFETALEQGYKVINLSYINQPSVARVCKEENLKNDIDCCEKFRQQRVFGDQDFKFIPDQSHDAIVSRLKHLLIYLSDKNPEQQWDIYLKNGEINWEMITVTGQSQGGGMSAFIAKQHLVNRIITFSGGWDFSERNTNADNKIANWYFNKSQTPSDRYYGTYHVKERPAKYMIASYKAMGIEEENIHGLSLEVTEGRKAHVQGVRNIAYKTLWIEMMGSGKL